MRPAWVGKRRDANEPDIVDGLTRAGAQVERLHKPCDLICRYRGQVFLLEVDNPMSKYRKREATQTAFLKAWNVPLVRTAYEALKAIGAVA